MRAEVAPSSTSTSANAGSPEVVRRIGELGWLGIPIPEDEGGAGLDTLAYAVAIEEIGRVWGPLDSSSQRTRSLRCGPPISWEPTSRSRPTWCRWHRAGSRRLWPDRARCRLGRWWHPDHGDPRGDPRRTGSRDLVPGGIQAFITNAGQAGRHRDGTHRGDANRRCRDQRLHRPRRHAGVQRRPPRGQALHASATGELRFECACRRPTCWASAAMASRRS